MFSFLSFYLIKIVHAHIIMLHCVRAPLCSWYKYIHKKDDIWCYSFVGVLVMYSFPAARIIALFLFLAYSFIKSRDNQDVPLSFTYLAIFPDWLRNSCNCVLGVSRKTNAFDNLLFRKNTRGRMFSPGIDTKNDLTLKADYNGLT